MKTKTLKVNISILVATLLLGTNMLFAQENARKMQRPERMGKIENLVSDLSADQKDQLAKLAKEYKEKTTDFREKLKVTNKELSKLKNDPNAKEADVYKKMDEVTELRNNLNKENYSYKKKIEKVLTPKQLEELRTQEAKMKDKSEELKNRSKEMQIRSDELKVRSDKMQIQSEDLRMKSERMKLKSDELMMESEKAKVPDEKTKEKNKPQTEN